MVANCFILIVDDDPAIRGLLQDAFSFEGYRVETAYHGADALAVIERLQSAQEAYPRVILLDMQMPVMDGRAFAAELRRRGLRLPILVMSAARQAPEWAAEIGATDYIPKPFDLEALFAAVQKLQASKPASGSPPPPVEPPSMWAD